MNATRWVVMSLCGLASMAFTVDQAQAQVRIGIGIGAPVGPRPYYGRPYYYAPPYYYPRVVVAPPPVVVRSTPVVVAQPDPIVTTVPAPASGATIRVLVPDPNAQVYFDGNQTRQIGTDRLFHTPPLAAGAPNIYRIRAVWNGPGGTLSQEQVVSVSPGQSSVVDFTRSTPPSEGLPLPK